MKTKRPKGEKLAVQLLSFIEANPDLRFWQALRAWTKADFILFSSHFDSQMFDKNWLKKNKVEIRDTFYLTKKK